MKTCLYSSNTINIDHYDLISGINKFIHVNIYDNYYDNYYDYLKEIFENTEIVKEKEYLHINYKNKHLYFYYNNPPLKELENIDNIFIGDKDLSCRYLKYLSTNKLTLFVSLDYNYQNDWNKLKKGNILFGIHNNQVILQYFEKFIVLEGNINFNNSYKFFIYIESEQYKMDFNRD